MDAGGLNERVQRLKDALETIEREVVRGEPTRECLEDFKLAIDHTRVSVWAILTAAQTGGHQSIVAKFRLKRATEICRHLIGDINSGLIAADDPELLQFQAAVEDAAGRVARLVKIGE